MLSSSRAHCFPLQQGAVGSLSVWGLLLKLPWILKTEQNNLEKNRGMWRKRQISAFLSGRTWYVSYAGVYLVNLKVSSQKWLKSCEPLFRKSNVQPPAACFACMTEYPNKYDSVFHLQLLYDHKFPQPGSPLKASYDLLCRETAVLHIFPCVSVWFFFTQPHHLKVLSWLILASKLSKKKKKSIFIIVKKNK